jgi:hypothetical protein
MRCLERILRGIHGEIPLAVFRWHAVRPLRRRGQWRSTVGIKPGRNYPRAPPDQRSDRSQLKIVVSRRQSRPDGGNQFFIWLFTTEQNRAEWCRAARSRCIVLVHASHQGLGRRPNGRRPFSDLARRRPKHPIHRRPADLERLGDVCRSHAAGPQFAYAGSLYRRPAASGLPELASEFPIMTPRRCAPDGASSSARFFISAATPTLRIESIVNRSLEPVAVAHRDGAAPRWSAVGWRVATRLPTKLCASARRGRRGDDVVAISTRDK